MGICYSSFRSSLIRFQRAGDSAQSRPGHGAHGGAGDNGRAGQGGNGPTQGCAQSGTLGNGSNEKHDYNPPFIFYSNACLPLRSHYIGYGISLVGGVFFKKVFQNREIYGIIGLTQFQHWNNFLGGYSVTFRDLAIDYQRQTSEKGFRAENKQRLNLSDRAYVTLLHDMEVFHVEGNVAVKNGGLPSSFVNRIFRSFRESAKASVSVALCHKRAELDLLLNSMTPEAGRASAIQLLLEHYKGELIQAVQKRRENGHSFSIRLDTDNMRYLAEDGQGESQYYADSIGRYIKAVLEEYAERPYVERERIYYKDAIVNKVPSAEAPKKMLKLTLISSHILYMKPIGLFQDPYLMYNYLAGMTSLQVSGGSWRPSALRLASIKECRQLEHPAFLSSDKVREIEKTIQKNGVQYLPDSQQALRIVVRFTPKGERDYQKMLHLRPKYIEKVEPLTYIFDCTRFQAETYFFKFGADAQVLEPKSLAEEFLQKYRSAVQLYEKGCP